MDNTRKSTRRNKDWDWDSRPGIRRRSDRPTVEKVFYCQYCGAETGDGKRKGRPCPNCGSTTGRPSQIALRLIRQTEDE